MKNLFFNRFLHFFIQKKEKITRISLGLFLVFGLSSLLFVDVQPITTWISALENLGYDLQVRKEHKPLGKNNSIIIIDIDDTSLQAKGRWPWPRETIADMVTNLYKHGATVVAFDVTFPDPEINIVQELIDRLKGSSPEIIPQLKGLKETFDHDALFAKSLELGDSVLGLVFTDSGKDSGTLPSPLIQLPPEKVKQLDIPNKQTYLSNISLLAKAAKTQGFINATPDPDGVLRFTPLLFRDNNNVYGSLALQAVSLYLLTEHTDLVTAQYGESEILEGIKLDRLFIPTDPFGRILIPFRGPPYTFPYISAIDVLNETVPKGALEGKLIFIGATASALGDTRPTAMASIFPGIEVHASIAAGIIDHYLPYKPAWGRGVAWLLMIILGSIYAILLPFFSILTICILCSLLPLALLLGNYWIWSAFGIVISILLPIGLILFLFILNMVWGYLFESNRAKNMKSMFGQYVPPAYLEDMIKKGSEFSLEGESKELSVLFADIRSFTNLSEKMTATELKQFLNRYFNPITEIIFNHQGTIDKYVGDMVMAFWGAPLTDPKHAFNAVTTGIAMQAELTTINAGFLAEKKPAIKIGIGINTGIMNVGDMGSKFRRAYTVLGDTVNLASRLEGQTKFYHIGILVGKQTYEQTKEEFAYRKVDKIKVKGKDTGIEVFTPVCKEEHATAEIKLELDIHHRAIDAYFNQKWNEAEQLFQHNIENYPANKELYEVYLERIHVMHTHPPSPNWDGAYVSLEK
jgi:adenylate cyclase